MASMAVLLHTISSTSQKAGYSQAGEKKGRNGKILSKLKLLAVAFSVGSLFGLGYLYKKMNYKPMPIANIDSGNDLLFSKLPPKERIAKSFVNENDTSNLQLTLYQYEPCPFCKKVRAFLDFSGLSYDVVEVNSVTKRQLNWSAYKKVPIVIVKSKDGYQQLNDSSMIISALSSLLLAPDQDITNIVKFFPRIEFLDESGKKQADLMNRYFLMFSDDKLGGRSKDSVEEERRWRKWSDDVLMHTLSPNIYRTWEESLEAFNLFSKNGDWDRLFPSWERLTVIYVGAAVMLLIGKRLKKRHGLHDDPRLSLYQEVGKFLKAVNVKGTRFMGGEEPNLADLAVYGCISSIDGTRSFSDLLSNTHIGSWYSNMKSVLESRRGKMISSEQ
uniref:Prostaglandin E synthase 2 n=1 Tax=Alona affinis TaxID=381656 RepID=A0A9N6WR16_9CRUS|nr:EOG090X08KD [Alona affinis]